MPYTPADFFVFLSLQLKCAYLIPTKAPLPEEAVFNQNKAAVLRQRATKNARSPSAIEMKTASRGGRRGSVATPLMKICRRRRCGVATYPAQRWIGATCRGHPCRRLPAPPRCHHRGGRRRPGTTRMWARTRDKQFALPERTSGRSVLAWRPAGWAPPSRREPHPAKLTPPRRSEERPALVR
jgi:hypothetical protein